MMTAVRGGLWVLFGLFFLFPLYAMADFSTVATCSPVDAPGRRGPT